MRTPFPFRTGHGYDVHRLVTGRPLVLGGVPIPFDKGLDGHSDADVLVHAVMDALLGAAGLGDIGLHFPDSDAYYKDIPSLVLLKKVQTLLRQGGWAVGNIDVTVVAQSPKLSPYKNDMADNLARTLGMDKGLINIKATTEEGLGFTGLGQGVAAHAVCLLYESREI
jgi:2-C-methyl-D-erythritol 2,4-cyclodiphosphate synthase